MAVIQHGEVYTLSNFNDPFPILSLSSVVVGIARLMNMHVTERASFLINFNYTLPQCVSLHASLQNILQFQALALFTFPLFFSVIFFYILFCVSFFFFMV